MVPQLEDFRRESLGGSLVGGQATTPLFVSFDLTCMNGYLNIKRDLDSLEIQ